MKNFIDFISVATKDNAIATEFQKQVDKSNNETLSTWFQEQGYNISADECKKLTASRDELSHRKVGFFY